MTIPAYDTTLTDLRAALVAVCAVITPSKTAKPYALYTQADFPYWTMIFNRLRVTQVATGEWRFDQGVVLTCRVDKVTADGVSVETEGQRILFQSGVEFAQRPFLQTDGTYADGVNAIDPDGITELDIQMLSLASAPEQVLAVQITTTIPLLFQLDRLSF